MGVLRESNDAETSEGNARRGAEKGPEEGRLRPCAIAVLKGEEKGNRSQFYFFLLLVGAGGWGVGCCGGFWGGW